MCRKREVTYHRLVIGIPKFGWGDFSEGAEAERRIEGSKERWNPKCALGRWSIHPQSFDAHSDNNLPEWGISV